jgi:putative redox protein
MMSETIRVEHTLGDQFTISARRHLVHVDQPVVDGGDDTAPTPTELFVASLAACVAFYAGRFLRRHALPETGLAVEAEYSMASKPARVGEVHLRLEVPDGVPLERLAALHAVASHCTVHNTLSQPPTVHLTLAPCDTNVAA